MGISHLIKVGDAHCIAANIYQSDFGLVGE